MADLNKIPLIDFFETTLAQPWDWNTGTVYLNDTPAFTFPSWVTTYVVVEPGTSNMQVAEIDSKGVGTVNVSSVTVEKWAGVNYSPISHSAQSKVIISDNYQFWKDIRTAINTKLDQDGWNGLTYATEVARDAALGWNGVATEEYRMIKVTSTGLFYNYNLSTSQWESVDTWTATPNGSEIVAGKVELATAAQRGMGTSIWETGARLVPSNDALVKTSSWASDENKIPVLDSTGKLAAWFIDTSIFNESLFGNSSDWVQGDSNLTITGSNNTFITKNFSSWTAWSVARTCTITPTNCVVWIKIAGNANFTNWTFNFAWVGWPWWAQQTGGTGNVWVVGNSTNYTVTANWAGWVLWAASAAWWAAWAKLSSSLNTNLFYVDAYCWAGGWSWGSNSQSGTNGWAWGAWGNGWGGLIITVWGTVVFSSTVATVAWSNGTAWTNGTGWASGWWGWWGWAGWTFTLLYRWTLTWTLTPTVSGWTGAAWGTGAGTTAWAWWGGAWALFNAGIAWASTSSSSTWGTGWNGWAGTYLIQKI